MVDSNQCLGVLFKELQAKSWPADTLLQRNYPGDRERAMSLLEESLPISSELGMRPLMERVLSSRDILRA